MMPEHRRVAIALRIDQPYPNHQDVLNGVLRYAREHTDWNCTIDEYPGYGSRSGGGQSEQYDGVIARAQPRMRARLRRRGIPVVNTMYYYAHLNMPGVYLDVYPCGRIAAEHLIERGFRRLAILDVGTYRQAKDIARAFHETATERGCHCLIQQELAGEYDDPEYWLRMRKHISQFLDTLTPPVGFLVSVPWAARLLISICEQRGWHVPQQVAIICVDDHKNITELPPQISCIDCNYEQIGYEAAALLERLMSGQPVDGQRILVAPRGIISRESTDYFAVEDAVVAEALRFIAKRLGEKLSVDMIAHEVAVSSRSLQRRFDRAIGRGVSEEIRRLRIETAKRLLGEERLQINRVAVLSGFNSSIILGQVFQRELGMSPSAYRKRVLKKPPPSRVD